MHPAADYRAYHAADGTADRAADRGGHGKTLRWLLTVRWSESPRSGTGSRARSGICSRPGTGTGTCSRPGTCAAS